MKVLLVILSVIMLIGVVSADTLIVYESTDGYIVEATDAQFLTMRAVSSGDSVINDKTSVIYIEAKSKSTPSNFDYMVRVGATFLTSALPDDATITAANLTVYGRSKTAISWSVSGVEITNFTPSNLSSYVKEDFSKSDFIPVVVNKSYSDWAINAWNTFNFNTYGLTQIKNTTDTSFMFTTTEDVYRINISAIPPWVALEDGSFGLYGGNVSGGIYKWYMTVVYTVPDTTPPNSITGLSNTTTCNSINWSFTKPGDADYGGLMVWKNGTFFHNLSSSATNDLWLNLTELTEYTFSSKTFDATNNINATFVNRTSTTAKCPPGPVASFISNVTCGIVPFRVLFNDTTYSTTNLTGWNWSFGDGNYSAVQNPVFEYNLSGMFTVNINATNAWGSNISQIPNYMRAVPNWATCPATPTPTPTWQPDINPSTELDVQPNGWWLIAGGMILFIWFIFRRTR